MLVCLDKKLAFLAMTKAASTSIETALTPHADIIFSGDSRVKHISARKFRRFMKPYLTNMGHEVETCCVFRDPIDWLFSWYCYRARPQLAGMPESTADISFANFAEDYLARPERNKGIGRPSRFVTDQTGAVIVDRIFRYDALPTFVSFLEERFETPLEIARMNTSETRDRQIAADLDARLKTYFAPEYAILDGAIG